jgi:hypothetical protein
MTGGAGARGGGVAGGEAGCRGAGRDGRGAHVEECPDAGLRHPSPCDGYAALLLVPHHPVCSLSGAGRRRGLFSHGSCCVGDRPVRRDTTGTSPKVGLLGSLFGAQWLLILLCSLLPCRPCHRRRHPANPPRPKHPWYPVGLLCVRVRVRVHVRVCLPLC